MNDGSGKEELGQPRGKISRAAHPCDLVDIDTISVDINLPQNERIIEFVRQIKNPYKFKCGKYTMTARYKKNGLTIEDCLMSMKT